MSIDFFWAAMVGTILGAAIGGGIVLMAQWRDTNWDDEE